jgi:hypothetical protein
MIKEDEVIDQSLIDELKDWIVSDSSNSSSNGDGGGKAPHF